MNKSMRWGKFKVKWKDIHVEQPDISMGGGGANGGKEIIREGGCMSLVLFCFFFIYFIFLIWKQGKGGFSFERWLLASFGWLSYNKIPFHGLFIGWIGQYFDKSSTIKIPVCFLLSKCPAHSNQSNRKCGNTKWAINLPLGMQHGQLNWFSMINKVYFR